MPELHWTSVNGPYNERAVPVGRTEFSEKVNPDAR